MLAVEESYLTKCRYVFRGLMGVMESHDCQIYHFHVLTRKRSDNLRENGLLKLFFLVVSSTDFIYAAAVALMTVRPAACAVLRLIGLQRVLNWTLLCSCEKNVRKRITYL
jgi:hypothetical protein